MADTTYQKFDTAMQTWKTIKLHDNLDGTFSEQQYDAGGAAAASMLGATADAAVDTDMAGTVSGKLRGLVKLLVNLLSRWPAALAANGGLKVEGVADGVAVPVDSAATTVTLYALKLTNANTEYMQELPITCRRVSLQCRTSFDVRLAFVTGKVATPTDPYMTVKAAMSYDSGTVKWASGSMFLASAQAGVIVEIEAWS